MVNQATVKATGEKLNVYKLHNGNFFDYDNMGGNMPPSAAKAGKKEFAPEELIIGKEMDDEITARK